MEILLMEFGHMSLSQQCIEICHKINGFKKGSKSFEIKKKRSTLILALLENAKE